MYELHENEQYFFAIRYRRRQMWVAQNEQLNKGYTIKTTITIADAPIAYADVLSGWQHNAAFRTFFIDLLAGTPFTAFRWDTPPVTATTVSRPFEFVLLNAPGLDKTADAAAFAEHFQTAESDGVVEFSNLGGDAILVVPCPSEPLTAYSHIAAFVRHAPPAQQHALWQQVGRAMQRRLNNKPVWLSTAGAGVAWLHIRLDDRPKYYGYTPFRAFT
jgi:hypothetical protein